MSIYTCRPFLFLLLSILVISPHQSSNLTDKLNIIFSQSFHEDHGIICIDPNAGSYGGLGNLILSFLGVLATSMPTNRTPVNNHPLLLAMFDHPDSKNWSFVSPYDVYRAKSSIKVVSGTCRVIQVIPIKKFPRNIGVLGCFWNFLKNPEIESYFQSNLGTISPTNVPYPLQLASILASWFLSNPNHRFAFLVRNHTQTLTNRECGRKYAAFDLAVQFRSWHDLTKGKLSFESSGGHCLLECAAIKSISLINDLNRSICVFVTSDNENFSNILVETLKNRSHLIKVASSTSLGSNSDWHSGKIIQKSRFSIADPELDNHAELLDWMIISNANHSVYTYGSTYALTARLRSGLVRQMSDYRSEFSRNICRCQLFPFNNT